MLLIHKKIDILNVKKKNILAKHSLGNHLLDSSEPLSGTLR